VIIGYLDPKNFSILPGKAYPVLVVDPDAVLPFPGTPQGLKTVPRWDTQIIQPSGLMQEQQLSSGHALYSLESRNPYIMEQVLGILVMKRPDHVLMVLRVA